MRRKRGAIRSTTSSSPRAQSTASSIAAMVTSSMAAQITTLIPAVVLERFPIESRRKERGFQALADRRGCGWSMHWRRYAGPVLAGSEGACDWFHGAGRQRAGGGGAL